MMGQEKKILSDDFLLLVNSEFNCIDNNIDFISRLSDITEYESYIIESLKAYRFVYNEKIDKAIEFLNNYEKTYVDDTYFLMIKGLVAAYNNQDEDAYGFYKESIGRDLYFENKWVRYLFAIYFIDSNYEESIQYLEESLQIDKNYIDAIKLKVYNLDAIQNCDLIIELYQKIGSKCLDGNILLYAGTAFYNCYHFDKAKLLLYDAVEIDPRNAEVHSMLGHYYHEYEANYEAAEKSYMLALSLDGSDLITLHSIAWLYSDWGKIEKAEQGFRKLIDLDSENILSYLQFIGFYIKNKNYKNAQLMLKDISELFGENYISEIYSIILEFSVNGYNETLETRYKTKYGEDSEQYELFVDLVSEFIN